MTRLFTVAFMAFCSVSIAQNIDLLWKSSSTKSELKKLKNTVLPIKHLFDLDTKSLKSALASAPKRDFSKTKSNTIISLPNAEGTIEKFQVYENSVMNPELAAKYPEIKSYVAVGIDNPSARAYFSDSPLGFKSMTLYPNEATVFIEPISTDLITYTVYKKSDTNSSLNKFECAVLDEAINTTQKTKSTSTVARYAADDGKLRTFRLALSCTAEYAAFFGGTKADALAGINNTLTRINGIFERDFGIKLILIGNNDSVIYTDAATDPYSDATSKSNWGNELKSNLNTTIGLANYDLGHLLGANSLNVSSGDAGGLGCVCSDFNKGKGYTCSNPINFSGDTFDIDFVAHEIGHQLGANHTFTYINDNYVSQMEPGSGSTIMSYAGSTSKDVQNFSDAYFHAISIQQVTDIIKNKTCAIVISTGNAVPVVNGGLDYTIPKGTPFQLIGSATDVNADDQLTYAWEEIDLGNASTTVPSTTALTGPLFRSYPPSTSNTRYFPKLPTILSGLVITSGTEIPVEVLPGVARTMNFRLTVRDNRAGGSANNTDDVIVTVDGSSGPFTVDSQNSNVSYTAGTSQTINWSVAGTNANGVNCATVDILLSTDGGKTFTINLLKGTPNTGSANVLIPNTSGTTNRIMIKGSNHIFFDINNVNFTITSSQSIDTIAPIASVISSSETTTSGTKLSWTVATDNVGVTGYNVYQNGVLKTTTTATSLPVSGLSPSTVYSFYIKAKDGAGNLSAASNTASVSTLAASDTSSPAASTLSYSGTTDSVTNLSWTAATDNVAVTGYNVYQNGVLKTTTTTTSLAVSGLSPSTVYSFYIKAKDGTGNLSLESNIISIATLPIDSTSEPIITPSYCVSNGISTIKEYINKIQIGTISTNSGNNKGYGNFTSISTDLIIGSRNTIVITPAWSGSSVNEAYRVWIDFNQDGDFDDNGELVFSKSKTKTATITGSLTIPTTAVLGKTRMRISMKNSTLPAACEIFPNGEVEDYTVTITSSTLKFEDNEVTATSVKSNILEESKHPLLLYPNPVKGDLLNISNLEESSNFRLFNIMGQEIERNHIENNAVYVGSLKAGVYLIEITNDTSKTTRRFIKK